MNISLKIPLLYPKTAIRNWGQKFPGWDQNAHGWKFHPRNRIRSVDRMTSLSKIDPAVDFNFVLVDVYKGPKQG